jgi:hypothetical protein
MFVYPLSAQADESLSALVCGHATDKNTYHSYVDNLYSALFTPIRNDVRTLLEIGILSGGSLRLWRDFFTSAEIHGVDIAAHSQIVGEPRIRTWLMDAYSAQTAACLPDQLDIIIDDGPHTLNSVIELFRHYPQKLKPGGLMIVEDVQSLDWFTTLIAELPLELARDILVYDMRAARGQYDDVALVWRKPTKQA